MNFKKITLLSLIIISSLVSIGQLYNFDTTENQNEWTQYQLGEISQFYEWEFDQASSHSAPFSLVHYYPVGGNDPVDDWIVSPEIDLSLGGIIDSLHYSYGGFGTPFEADTLALYILEGSPDPNLASSKTLIYNFADSIYITDNLWHGAHIELENFSDQSYLAIRYSTDNNWLDVRFDDINIIPSTVSVNEENELFKSFSLFPNPSSDLLIINSALQNTDWRITNQTGKTILMGKENKIDISTLTSGHYLITIDNITKKFIKE